MSSTIAIGRLGNDDGDQRGRQKRNRFRACLLGGGGPQIGEVTWGGSPQLSCKRDQIKMRDYMDV